MKKVSNYGRRIVRVEMPNGEIIRVWSGQWVGHTYGNEFGSEIQRSILLKNCGGARIIEVEQKIFWSQTGYSGQRVM